MVDDNKAVFVLRSEVPVVQWESVQSSVHSRNSADFLITIDNLHSASWWTFESLFSPQRCLRWKETPSINKILTSLKILKLKWVTRWNVMDHLLWSHQASGRGNIPFPDCSPTSCLFCLTAATRENHRGPTPDGLHQLLLYYSFYYVSGKIIDKWRRVMFGVKS